MICGSLVVEFNLILFFNFNFRLLPPILFMIFPLMLLFNSGSVTFSFSCFDVTYSVFVSGFKKGSIHVMLHVQCTVCR